jgi:nicotinate-nucleotide adenylyltransferase
VGVLGGTFDPVHQGHLVAASEVHGALDLDEVLFVPTGLPWQKADRVVSSSADRVRMTELAVEHDDRFRVSRVDVDRPGPTYTADTLRDLRAVAGAGVELHFLVGADALAGLPTWHDLGAVLDQALVVGFVRGDQPLAVPAGLPADRFRLVDTTPIGISSTRIRARVREGASVRYLVPDAVERHIRSRGLYLEAA